MVIVAAGRAFHHREAFPSVARTIQRRVWYIHGVRVFWVDTDFAEIPSASPDSPVFRNTFPNFSRIIGAVESALLRIHNKINAFWIAGSKRDAHAAQFCRRQSVSGELLPMFAAILRTIEAGAGSFGWRIDIPRRPARLQ